MAYPHDPDRFPAGLPVVRQMGRTASGRAWLDRLPGIVREIEERWELRLGAPFHGGSCSWVAPAEHPGGGSAVLKVTWPHREADGEAPALHAWDGNGAVRLLRRSRERGALLIERCRPGTPLGDAPLPPAERLTLAAGLLRKLWAAPTPPDGELERMDMVCAEWADILQERMLRLRPGYDPGLVALGADLLRTLPTTATREAVVHGDFNTGNVLTTERRPWLAIDPKPMVGDPAYDPWPLLTQLDDPFTQPDPRRVLRERYARVADALDEDPTRLLAWSVARGVESALWSADHDDVVGGAEELAEARLLAELAGTAL
ncbi:aminoglycoside phosphotransferase family protein [Streptomyces decoyicus]|uniref:Aminoglycoside phosphotransferase family protein n=1 Tax=Streptomyces decoyicus TaxID=249567 RepID=A0ABZ1FBF0_9ACTN|nr:aminoglycoside phosphotransferase family protein [Streptomyces decoyicus]WSB67693.1 aminoglycoside phosphotransferase family protein [Streptomyces decoyicus]